MVAAHLRIYSTLRTQPERALFAFSQNYFPNSTLIMKSSLKDMTDIGAARILEKKYKEYQLLALSKTKLLTS